MKQSVTVGAQLLWGGRYGCNNGRYGFTIVMSYIEINKAVSQWLLTFNLCVSLTWPLTCAFHIPCTHTPEIIDLHRVMCDKITVQHHDTNTFFTSHCVSLIKKLTQKNDLPCDKTYEMRYYMPLLGMLYNEPSWGPEGEGGGHSTVGSKSWPRLFQMA